MPVKQILQFTQWDCRLRKTTAFCRLCLNIQLAIIFNGNNNAAAVNEQAVFYAPISHDVHSTGRSHAAGSMMAPSL